MNLSCERSSSSSKRRGEVDRGGYSEVEFGAGGDSLSFHQLTHPPIHFALYCRGLGRSDPH